MIRPGIRRLFRLPLRRADQVEQELDAEIRLHVELRAERLRREGLAPDEAWAEALRRFGPLEEARATLRGAARRREERLGARESLAGLRQDLRYAARTLRGSPAFTLAAVLTLALGIGATSSIFSVVHGVLLRPLPFPAPERLVQVRTVTAGAPEADDVLSPPNFMSLAERSRAFGGVAAVLTGDHVLGGAGEARTVESARVSASFFGVMGVRPVLGRGFVPAENQPGSDGVVVLGWGLWQRAFGGDPGVVGRTVRLDGVPREVVGVMPRGFDFPAERELWVPLPYDGYFSATGVLGRKGNAYVTVLARLRPGVGLEEGRAELRDLAGRLQAAFPASNTGVGFTAVPLRDALVGEARKPLLLLFGAVGLVLLVAAANVVGLLLARAATREGEMAVRVALGAGRGRLVRQLLTESLLLGLAGGGLGLLLALWTTRALVALRPEGMPRVDSIRVDGPVLAFTLAVALATSVLAGLVPALRATEGGISGTLRGGGRGGLASRRGNRLRGGLVVGQMALAVVLLAGAGLLLRSFARLVAVDPGFRVERVLAFRVELPRAAYDSGDETSGFYARFLERVHGLPGVEAAGAVYRLPIAQGSFGSRFEVEGRAVGAGEEEPSIGVLSVTPGYFRTLGVPLLRGRGIEDGDRAGGPPVVVINRAAAERFFSGVDPVGRRLARFSFDPIEAAAESFTVVGVVGDVRGEALDRAPEPEAFFAHAQVPLPAMSVVVRASGDPLALAGAVRRELSALDPDLPAPEFRTLEQVVAESVARPRFLAGLLTLFAAAALSLAALGVYGLLSYAVAQRTREIGVRIALGARPRDVLEMVVRRALALAGAGVVLGLGGALTLTRLLESQLFGVGAGDPATLAAVVSLLGAAALLASLVPARRAARMSPLEALRAE